MGSVIAFTKRPTGDRGIIHVWAHEDEFEIAQESSSGDSWGSFARFPDAKAAVSAAYRLNQDVYENACDVFIAPAVIASLPVTPCPPRGDR